MAADGGDVTLDPDDVVEILEAILPAQNKSYELGLKLKVPLHDMQAIQKENLQPQDRLCEVIVRFLQGVEPTPTWRVIVDALRSPAVNLPNLAKQVETAHQLPPNTAAVSTTTHDVETIPTVTLPSLATVPATAVNHYTDSHGDGDGRHGDGLHGAGSGHGDGRHGVGSHGDGRHGAGSGHGDGRHGDAGVSGMKGRRHGYTDNSFNLKEKRGLGILVTHRGKKHPFLPVDRDASEMIATLQYLDYDIHQLHNDDATKLNLSLLLNGMHSYLHHYDGVAINNDGSRKAIIFAFAGHGGNVCIKCSQMTRHCSCHGNTTKEDAIELDDGPFRIKEMIITKLLVPNEKCLAIPKLFFIDACRGNDDIIPLPWYRSRRAQEHNEVNYRIDYATIPDHTAPGADQWLIKTAELLRESHMSLGDVMDTVRKYISDRYHGSNQDAQMPETLNRLTTGPLHLKPTLKN